MSAASLTAFERPKGGASNTVFKSGPLFISSKGMSWKSWKKRWFILTRTSLVFFKNDPVRIHHLYSLFYY
uniref:Rho GTPase-activating protein 7 isoform X2 n=1 Tax=Rhizophora mucronata TaxID=61149 RepID=A0A2P2MTG1_RHIMU